MKKGFLLVLTGLASFTALGNQGLSGAHGNYSILNEIVAVVIVSLANFVLIIQNISWKKKWMTIVNSIMTVPLAIMTFHSFKLYVPLGLFISAVIMVHLLMIYKSQRKQSI